MQWPTFILDIANNHGGSLDKAKEIVDAHAVVLRKHYAVNTAFKLQYRDLTHYQHGDETYRKKFQDAWLSWTDYNHLTQYIRKQGFLTACTPFDPSAAGWMGLSGFDYAKVASCSARDWRTIEAVAELSLPTIFSTAGLSIDGIDNIVSYAEHKGMRFALMHCVAVYPSKLQQLNLSRIAELRQRYPHITVGWSTHERPTETGPVQMAWAYGARIFERHVALPDSCNAYSSVPKELDAWLTAYEEATEMGEYNPGETIGLERMALAKVERQGIDMLKHQHPLKCYVHRTKASLNIAKIALPTDLVVEFSHHYGVGNFASYGAVLITLVNREYCKKLIVVQSGQRHPAHYHRHKEETFQVLHGRLWIDIEGHERELRPGELVTVLPGQWHQFAALEDHTIFEEISTTALPGDSVYRDPLITVNKDRKTAVKHWGRFELG